MSKATLNRNGNKVNIDLWHVRRDLSNGSKKGFWQIKHPDGREVKFNPEEVIVEMTECFLHNGKSTTEKILAGAHKQRCAWIACENVKVFKGSKSDLPDELEIKFNPREKDHFDLNGEDVDGKEFTTLITQGKRIFVKKH